MFSIRCALLSLAIGAMLPFAVAQDPDASKEASVSAARAAAEKAWDARDFAAAADAYAKVVEVASKDSTAWFRLGYALHAEGRIDEALKAHLRAAEMPGVSGVAAYNAACAYALKGEKDKAFEWLRKAQEKGYADRSQITSDTDLASLRDDPRYEQFLASLKDPDPTEGAQAFAQTNERESARFAVFGRGGSPGQICVDYGPAEWKDDYAKALESEQLVGKRWRFGKDFWTRWDSNVDATVGGQRVPAGSYYLTLERKADGVITIAFNDPAKIRAAKLDAFQAPQTTGGIEVPMKLESSDEVAEKLSIELAPRGAVDRTALVVSFGPHRLSAPVELEF